MIVNFVVLGAVRPIGGVIAIYQLANGLARRGHLARLLHVWGLKDLRAIDWFEFDARVEHVFLKSAEEVDRAPAADFIVNPSAPGSAGGLPLTLVQGYGVFSSEAAASRLLGRWPKVCVSMSVLEDAARRGVPRFELAYVPNGIDHAKYSVRRALDRRPVRVAMRYGAARVKAAGDGIEAIAEAKRRVPEMTAVLFGSVELCHTLPPETIYMRDASQEEIVDRVYNEARVFVTSSLKEGFGLCSAEAMACGCALATTANGGASEYAKQGETALVSEPGDVAALADNIERLLVDDARRIEQALRGAEHVRRFDWDESARLLEDVLVRYQADPSAFRGEGAGRAMQLPWAARLR